MSIVAARPQAVEPRDEADLYEHTDDDAPDAPPRTGRSGAKAVAAKAWPTVADHARSAQSLGPRFPLGILPLDELCRGGIREEKTCTVGGGPGAGKTTAVVQSGVDMSRRGIAVAILSDDEEPSALVGRIAQALGFTREQAESPTADVIERIDLELGALPFWVVEDMPLEAVFVGLAERYPNHRRVVIADSLQTIRTSRTDLIESKREQIDDKVRTAKRLARAPATRAAFIATSELSRAGYASKKLDEHVEDLAAFKESGGIEYAAHVALVMRRAKDDPALVHVNVVKNRLGRLGAFALRLDFARATFSPADIATAPPTTAGVDDTAEARQRIVVNLTGERLVKTKDLAKACGIRRERFWKALGELIERHVVTKNGDAVGLTSALRKTEEP